MKTTSRLAISMLAGGALAGCHHRQADPVYTAPTETVVTTTTTSSSATEPAPMTGSGSMAPTERRENGGAMQGARMERREIHLAMAAVERARRELERSGHDFGGRKNEALKATGAAMRELRLASGQESRDIRTGTETTAERRVEAHELHLALVDLERARADMEHAKHDFSGRRRETIEAVDAAIHEIRLAAEHEKH